MVRRTERLGPDRRIQESLGHPFDLLEIGERVNRGLDLSIGS